MHHFPVGWGDRRDERRWQRELEEQLRALPTYDGDTPDGGSVTPIGRDLPRRPKPPKQRRAGVPREPGRPGERRRTVVTVVLTLAVITAVGLSGLTPFADQLRGALGFGDRGDTTEYAFLNEDMLSGKPYTWSSCEPIRYVVNPEQAPRGWEDDLDDAISAVSDATGLEFVDEGLSDDGPDDARIRGGRVEPVLISWVRPDQVPALEDDVVGVAGPQGRGRLYETGTVFLDAPAFIDMHARGERALATAVVMHELGHLVGLDHVDDDRQLMFPSTTFQTTFGNGDLEGLMILGEGPCR